MTFRKDKNFDKRASEIAGAIGVFGIFCMLFAAATIPFIQPTLFFKIVALLGCFLSLFFLAMGDIGYFIVHVILEAIRDEPD